MLNNSTKTPPKTGFFGSFLGFFTPFCGLAGCCGRCLYWLSGHYIFTALPKTLFFGVNRCQVVVFSMFYPTFKSSIWLLAPEEPRVYRNALCFWSKAPVGATCHTCYSAIGFTWLLPEPKTMKRTTLL